MERSLRSLLSLHREFRIQHGWAKMVRCLPTIPGTASGVNTAAHLPTRLVLEGFGY
jgi:hypothetical protein